jgi:hypothetical protein
MRASTAFFAGAGTVIMVVAGGLGGGLMIANTMNPKAPAAQTTKLERRASEPSPSPSPSPRSGAPQAAMTTAGKDVPAKDAPAQTGQDSAKMQASTQSAAQSSTATATNLSAASEPSPARSPSSALATQRDTHDKPGTPEAAFAKAREADLKTPDADAKHNAQKRQTRNHQQWADRRRIQRQPEADSRDAEQALRDDGDTRSYRDDNGSRSYSDQSGMRGYRAENRARVYPDDGNVRRYEDGSGRDYAAEPVELELPRIRLFDGF